jgi:hypothetical protein
MRLPLGTISGSRRWNDSSVDVPEIVAGVLLFISPFEARRSIRRASSRIAARGGDSAEFDRRMDRPWIRAIFVAAPVAGVLFTILGVTGA